MAIMLVQVSRELSHDIYRCSFDDSIYNLLSDDERVEKQTYTPRSTMQGQPPSLFPPPRCQGRGCDQEATRDI